MTELEILSCCVTFHVTCAVMGLITCRHFAHSATCFICSFVTDIRYKKMTVCNQGPGKDFRHTEVTPHTHIHPMRTF